MAQTQVPVTFKGPMVVGSFGSHAELSAANAISVGNSCDLAEIRLDLITADPAAAALLPWRHLLDLPLLFTARRQDEGGGQALTASARMKLLEPALPHAAWLDIEVASIAEMKPLLTELERRQIPWLASWHDFEKLPATSVLDTAAQRASDAGAAAFKVAAWLQQPTELARLADFQLADHGIPLATMGMGPLAAVSRLLCAQCGSVFNYGYLGHTATAPGQWDAALLHQLIARLTPLV